MKHFFLLSILIVSMLSVCSQSTKYFIPVNFGQAYENETRSMDGRPGTNYWQNRADYEIAVGLNPADHSITGSETIAYFNNSPDTLNYLLIHLFPNLYKAGGIRDFEIDPSDASEGIQLDEIRIDGKIVSQAFTQEIENNLVLYLPEPLVPGSSTDLGFKWKYTLNEKSHYREGVVDESSFFVAYFFPRIAVYDDIDGWNDWSYSGTAEFYNDFGNFDVDITVPENYMVWATGEWQNPYEILSPAFLQKYEAAKSSDEIVKIITKENLKNDRIFKNENTNTFRFRAKEVSDFAFGTSDHYLWDGSGLMVDTATGRRVFIDAAYNPASRDFYEVAFIARKSIQIMSFNYPAIPFPYPKMTVFKGLSEMEYPMMVNDISLPDLSATIKLTAHEISHTYFPFLTGLNETKYAWMDEGLTSYGESLIATAIDSVEYAGFYFEEVFEKNMGHDYDMPLFTCSEYLVGDVYYFNSYPKAALFFKMLHEYLGNETYLNALQTFVERWKGKHPTPHDFIFTFEDVTGEDLSWFINPWVFEYGYVDFSIEKFSDSEITINKIGHYPAPIAVKIKYNDGNTETKFFTAGIWKNGNTTFSVSTKLNKKFSGAKLLNILGLDTNPENDLTGKPFD